MWLAFALFIAAASSKSVITWRNDFSASSSIILSAKVSKCAVSSCANLWASVALTRRCFISVAERLLGPLLKSLSSTSWSPLAAILKIEVSIVSALLIDEAIACLESSAASVFWDWSRSECQPSFWYFLKRLDRETPNFWDNYKFTKN